ncbi:hypothetical protein GCM10025879_20020 [Leuconostoc litchii]|uniref:Uncharacterized protein n=1 Tax=Leuconostoc litchii TaxID=1981069 RepID=A0A6P2CLU7_9LACO|nr:hypothetical protein [Leuconostoc litchii]TYC46856.1 hypothetical protein ESZ47_01565 [Leuconostoc litchii]GMA68758.1 hypothetical protein GCM10025879_00040 [Leuconostoc litchii]GMA70756.1 hypothetical protein GCM10025879_20020 [Leuconostoc litchii]
MKKLVRVIWKLILTFDGIVFCSSVGATIWFSLLKKFPLIDIDASTAKVICHYLFMLFTITIVLNVLLACIMIAVDLWSKSDVGFEQGGLIVGTAKSEQIPFTRRNLDRGAPTKPTKQ